MFGAFGPVSSVRASYHVTAWFQGRRGSNKAVSMDTMQMSTGNILMQLYPRVLEISSRKHVLSVCLETPRKILKSCACLNLAKLLYVIFPVEEYNSSIQNEH